MSCPSLDALTHSYASCVITLVLTLPELTGRFLHITDLHPDPFYKEGATFGSACHLRPGEKPHDGSAKGKWKRRLDFFGDEREDDVDVAEEEDLDASRNYRKSDVAGKYGNIIS